MTFPCLSLLEERLTRSSGFVSVPRESLLMGSILRAMPVRLDIDFESRPRKLRKWCPLRVVGLAGTTDVAPAGFR